jgi:hypothetical protein
MLASWEDPVLRFYIVHGFYFVVSTSFLLLNKLILSGEDIGLAAPFFSVWIQLAISTLCFHTIGRWTEQFASTTFN